MILARRKKIYNFIIAMAVILAAFFSRQLVYQVHQPVLEQLLNLIRFFLYAGLIAAWGISVYRRVMIPRVRLILTAVAVFMIFWLTVREYKWHIAVGEDANRFLWYLYYIPILVIPLLAIYISFYLGKAESYRLPFWVAFPAFPTAALVLLVLTNDLHRFVFVFPENSAILSESAYSYGAGFYLILTWVFLCSVMAYAVMFYRCRLPHMGRMEWLPVLFFGMDIFYVALYALRSRLIVTALDDVAVVHCLLIMAFFESCIISGLIQTDTLYPWLFTASENLSAQITDESYNVKYASKGAFHPDKKLMERAEIAPVMLSDGKRLMNMPINGGHTVWLEDVSGLLAYQNTLLERQEELQERRDFLKMEYDMEEAHRLVSVQNGLYDLLLEKTSRQLRKISDLAEEYQSIANEEKKKRLLAEIVFLGCFIKRRKDFVLSVEDKTAWLKKRLESAFEETLHSLGRLGIKGGYLVDAEEGLMEPSDMARVYELFEAVCEELVFNNKASKRGDGSLYLNTVVFWSEGNGRCIIRTEEGYGKKKLKDYFPGLIIENEEDETVFILKFYRETEK